MTGFANPHYCLAIVLLTLTLVGCVEEEAVDDLKQYQQRLANVLNTEFNWSKPNTTLSFPAKHQLTLDIPEANINLRDFYALQQCAVGTLIAERNTALGKIQLPSRRYHYEVKLLQGLEQCLQSTEDQNLKLQLTKWIQQKRLALPLVWTDLIQSSSETKQAFSSNQGYLNQDAAKDLTKFTRAFHYLVTLPIQMDVDILELEDNLNTLRQTEYVARLWKTQKLLIAELKNATKLLIGKTSDIQCDNSNEKQQVDYLHNVFKQFFIERIQPLAGIVDKSNYVLRPAFDQLLNSTSINILLKQLISQNLQDFTEYQSAVSLHVMLWQDLLKRCNMSPQKTQ